MKCPLLRITRPWFMQADAPPQDDCLKEECAGWDSISQTCVAISIYQELRLLVGAVSMLADKLPTPPTIKR